MKVFCEKDVSMQRFKHLLLFMSVGWLVSACSSSDFSQLKALKEYFDQPDDTRNSKFTLLYFQKVSYFNSPWALAALPDGRLLVTEKAGAIKLFEPATQKILSVAGVPTVVDAGQGGLGDIVLHPDFQRNHLIYFSYVESSDQGTGAVVDRAELDLSQAQQPRLLHRQRIWTQQPKVRGHGHFSYRVLFDRDGKLWISSGERQQFSPAQDLQSHLGKIVRLNADGSVPADNPLYAQGGTAAQLWSWGHRNPLGIAFDSQGQLWEVEMGPKGGDELNQIHKGRNYGYPLVSNGDHYSGIKIPRHSTRPEFQAPVVSWTPVISPSSLIIYQGKRIPQWTGKALIGGLSSESIIVVDLQQKPIKELERIEMGQRIRGLLQTPTGDLWVIEDGENAALLKLQ